jgi:hypothetical protein
MGGLIDLILDALRAVGAVAVLAYVLYMVGLIFVLRRMDRLSWMAFVPLVNYYAQVRAVNAPRRWFALALTPYIGAVYAGSVAIRLGEIFGRGPAFSLLWLTIGAPIGMFIIAFASRPLNVALLDQPLRLMNIKAIKQRQKAEAPRGAGPRP